MLPWYVYISVQSNGNGKLSGPGQGPVITSRTTKRTKPYLALPVNPYPCRRGEDDAKTSEGARGRSSCCVHLVPVPVRSDLVSRPPRSCVRGHWSAYRILTWLQRSENSQGLSASHWLSWHGFLFFPIFAGGGPDNGSDKDKRGGCLLLDIIK